MYDNRSTTVSDQNQSLCDQNDCELRKKGGVWICCLCEFGYEGSDRNRNLHCLSCNHEVCSVCKEWNQATVAELITARMDDANGDEE